MAQKRINDLQLRSDFDETCNFPTDDLVQTWRVTGAQILSFVSQAIIRAFSSKTSAYTVLITDSVILADATSAAFTLTLPAAASSSGKVFSVKKIDSSLNAVIIDPNSSELIDGATTFSLTEQYQSISFISNGTAWFII